VCEEGVGDGGEAEAGFLVVDGDGFLAEIRGGHDESLDARVCEKQMVQGRVGRKRPSHGMPGATDEAMGSIRAYAAERWGGRGW